MIKLLDGGSRRAQRLLSAVVAGLLLVGALAVGVTPPAAARSTSGTDFWVAFFPNINTPSALELFVTGDRNAMGTVSGGPIAEPISFTVTAGAVTTISIPISAMVPFVTGISDRGIRVTADAPVTLYGINQAPATTDGFLAIPVEALGSRYRIGTITGGGVPGGGDFGVIATVDATVVSVNGSPVGTLNAGQVYFETGAVNPSGTLVTADQPVAVFAGHQCSNYPGGACDHLVEQLPPTDAWGTDFVVLRYADDFNATNLFVVVADQDDTVVSVDGVEVQTLAAGGSLELRRFGKNGESKINGGRITASKPVLLLQFLQGGSYGNPATSGDPAMSVIPPFEQFQTSYTLATMANGFVYNAVNVVIPTAAVPGFRLDGAAVAGGTFEPIGSTGFSGAQIEIAAGTHTLRADQAFGVFLYGANPADSYAVPGGMSLSPVALVSSLTLASGVTTGTIDEQPSVCFAVTVRDAGGDPLAGIRVDFSLSGELTDIGAATSDENGVATFCVVNTSVAGGTVGVTATVGGLTATGDRTIPAPGEDGGGGGDDGGGDDDGGDDDGPITDPDGGLPTSMPPGSSSGSVGGVSTPPSPSVPTDDTASYQVGDVQFVLQLEDAGTVSGPSDAPVLEVVRDRTATISGEGMAPGGIVEVWIVLPDGGSRLVALLPVGDDGTFGGPLPFTGELDGDGPLPIGDRTIQLFGTDANGQVTVLNVAIRIEQPGPFAPEPERDPGAPPTLEPGQTLITIAGIPTAVTVTPLPDQRTVLIEGDGWQLEIDVPEGVLRDEEGNPIFEIVLGDDTEVRGTGFMAGTRAYVWLMSTPRFLGEVTVGPDGTFVGALPVNGVQPGQHTLQVSGVGTDGYIRAANLGVIIIQGDDDRGDDDRGDDARGGDEQGGDEQGDGTVLPRRVSAGEGGTPLLTQQFGGLVLAAGAGLGAALRPRRRVTR
jgi:hypothetical protein